MDMETVSFFTTGEKYELAELTMRNMIHAYKHGAIPPQCLINTAMATWTDDFLFEECPELRPAENIKNEKVREFIEQELPDLSEEDVDYFVDSEMEYRHNVEPRRHYVIHMYLRKHGITILKALHPEWLESINAYIKYVHED